MTKSSDKDNLNTAQKKKSSKKPFSNKILDLWYRVKKKFWRKPKC